MDCLASLPKMKDTGCKCISFRVGTFIFSVLHLILYIATGVILYDLDPNMHFPIICIFTIASIGATSAILGAILVCSI
uniref:CSON000522 protein n=1 Tax=Culicoides sonorensis TaxID=179676 RepID=A0A336MEU0_CULSO